MAEINTSTKSNSKKGAGVKQLKRKSTPIDLTPMVDLGFLLITFFVFTATMSQPSAMKLILPDDKDITKTMATKESGALTFLLSENNSVYYYEGKLDISGSNVYVSTINEVRDIIIKKKRNTWPDNFFVIIKPAKKSIYRDIVNMLDEMTINDIERYALVDITETEEQVAKMFDERRYIP